jgi:hypothetical protein
MAVGVPVAVAGMVGTLVFVGNIVEAAVGVALGRGVLGGRLVGVCVEIGVTVLKVSSNKLSKHRPEKYSSLSTSEKNRIESSAIRLSNGIPL